MSFAINIKNGNCYEVIGEVVNRTNAQDGQTMILYEKDGNSFVREKAEFLVKFKLIDIGSHISRMVGNHFYLQSWKDDHGKGVWLALGLMDHLDHIRDLSSYGLNIHSVSWLPYVIADDLDDAIEKLEAKLSSICRSRKLHDDIMVAKVINKTMDSLTESAEISDSVPKTFDEALRAFLKDRRPSVG